MYVRPSSGTTNYKGHVVTLPHNVQHIVNMLPRSVTDMSVLCFIVQGAETNFVQTTYCT